jgi:hypothetical protein
MKIIRAARGKCTPQNTRRPSSTTMGQKLNYITAPKPGNYDLNQQVWRSEILRSAHTLYLWALIMYLATNCGCGLYKIKRLTSITGIACLLRGTIWLPASDFAFKVLQKKTCFSSSETKHRYVLGCINQHKNKLQNVWNKVYRNVSQLFSVDEHLI